MPDNLIRSIHTFGIPPGSTIRELLADREMTQKEFAVRVDLSEKHVSHLINGKVELTHDVAYRMEAGLGIPVSFWNNLEALFEHLAMAQKAAWLFWSGSSEYIRLPEQFKQAYGMKPC